MATNGCNEFLKLSDGWLEGERLPGAEEHLRACHRCQAVLADFETIRSAGLRMGEEEFSPPTRVWQKIQAQLEAEGLTRQPGWAEQLADLLAFFPRPALASVYFSLILAGALLLGYQKNVSSSQQQWLAGTQTTSDSVANQLQTAELGSVDALASDSRDPMVTTSLNQNLAIVDNLIAVCEKSVREDPEDEMARDYLYGAYEQKAELLATMNEHGVNEQ
jgi:hypothetical protein